MIWSSITCSKLSFVFEIEELGFVLRMNIFNWIRRFLITDYKLKLKPWNYPWGRVESIYVFNCYVGFRFHVRRRRESFAGGGNFGLQPWLHRAWFVVFNLGFEFLEGRTIDLHRLVPNRGGSRHLRRLEAAPVANCNLATQLSEMVKFKHCTFRFYKTVPPPSFESLHFRPWSFKTSKTVLFNLFFYFENHLFIFKNSF